jgi:PhoD-like phosphatase
LLTKFDTERFFDNTNETSGTGTFKTVPLAHAGATLHFGFSGDNDGLMRPFALGSVLPSQQLDFYLNLGDVIYETASNVNGNIGTSYLNSPSVTLSNDSLSFNGVPRAFIPGSAPFATQTQLKADYEKKYRENFLPVNAGGQNSLQVMYAAQGNYTTWDNHEQGNRKYIDGGAPAGGSVGGPTGTNMPTGRGVDARDGGAGNPGNVNDVNASAADYMNRATGFRTLQNVFLEYQPIADRGTVSAPSDSRTDGTRKLYSAVQWGRNALFVNTDSRSYRDIRLKMANAAADDTGARADNPNRTFLSATQLAWLKQTLLTAQNNGTTWKFVSVSDPIDQLGPIGGALSGVTAATMQPFSRNVNYAPVNSDGGKSYIGGYRAERNDLLKFIADHHITNVVFLSTDDHQNRINELYYSPTGQTDVQSSYVKVPYTFAIVCGPLGATEPDLFTNHNFAGVKGAADLIASAEIAAGIDPIGLQNYPGLHDLLREGDPTAGTSPQPVDFYSPDTFNFTVLDVSPSGKTLTVKSVGMNSTAQNAAVEPNGTQARTIFSFQIDGFGSMIESTEAIRNELNDARASAENNKDIDTHGRDQEVGRRIQPGPLAARRQSSRLH